MGGGGGGGGRRAVDRAATVGKWLHNTVKRARQQTHCLTDKLGKRRRRAARRRRGGGWGVLGEVGEEEERVGEGEGRNPNRWRSFRFHFAG